MSCTGKRFWWAATLFAIIVGLLALALLSGSPGYSTSTQRLADGSNLKIVSMSYGHTHSYTLSHPKTWQRFLAAHLPSFMTDHLSWWDNSGGGAFSSARPGESNLAVFTICEQAGSRNLWRSPQMAVYDENGQMYGMGFIGVRNENHDFTHRRQLALWVVSNLPLNDKRLVLRFSALAADGKTQQRVAEFIVSNPALTNTTQGQREPATKAAASGRMAVPK
jgi:hypothetical protein